MWRTTIKNKVIEELMVTGNNFLATVENTALFEVFQLDGATHHLCHCVHVFLDREFSNRWTGRTERAHFLAPLVLRT
jgi:hypothetical protein